MLSDIFSDRQEDADPGIMPSAAEQIDHILKRRMMRGRPAARERTLDVSQQLAGRTIDFQGRVPGVRKIGASVTADRMRVNAFGSALGSWHSAFSILPVQNQIRQAWQILPAENMGAEGLG